jgi:hypothetical protein
MSRNVPKRSITHQAGGKLSLTLLYSKSFIGAPLFQNRFMTDSISAAVYFKVFVPMQILVLASPEKTEGIAFVR